MRKILLIISIIMLAVMLSVSAAAADYYVFDADDLDGNITVGGGLVAGEKYLRDGDKLYSEFYSNTTGASNNGSTMFNINTPEFASEVTVKDFPVIKIGYRSNIAANVQVTLNVGLDYSTKSNAKLFTIWKQYDRSGNAASIIYDLTTSDFNVVEGIAGSTLSGVADASKYNYIYIKPYVSNQAMVSGEHFDIEYIGFFKNANDAQSYTHVYDFDSAEVTDLVLREQVRRVVAGESIKLTALVKPSFIGTDDVQYTSSAPSVATVTNGGVVTGVSSGTTTITASSGGKSSTCKVIVLAEEIAAVKLTERTDPTVTEVKTTHLGDSITTYTPGIPSDPSYPRRNYHDWWGELYYIDNQDCGISGTCVTKDTGSGPSFLSRFESTMRDDAELVTVKGGTNDNSSTPTGTVDDRTTATYAGAIKLLMEGLIEKYPNKQIVFFSPIKRCKGDVRLTEYVDILISIGKIYDIPVIDIYNPSALDFRSELIQDTVYDNPDTPESEYKDPVYESPLMPDGLHPSGMGHKILQEYMMNQMIAMGIVNNLSDNGIFEGDVNGDAWVDQSDIDAMGNSLAGGTAVDSALADCNGDGLVNSLDIFILSRHLAGWKGYEALPYTK